MGHVSVALFGEKAKSGGKTPRKLAERHDNLRFGGKTPRKLARRGKKRPIGAKTGQNSAERGGAEQIGAKIEGFDAEDDGEGKKKYPRSRPGVTISGREWPKEDYSTFLPTFSRVTLKIRVEPGSMPA